MLLAILAGCGKKEPQGAAPSPPQAVDWKGELISCLEDLERVKDPFEQPVFGWLCLETRPWFWKDWRVRPITADRWREIERLKPPTKEQRESARKAAQEGRYLDFQQPGLKEQLRAGTARLTELQRLVPDPTQRKLFADTALEAVLFAVEFRGERGTTQVDYLVAVRFQEWPGWFWGGLIFDDVSAFLLTEWLCRNLFCPRDARWKAAWKEAAEFLDLLGPIVAKKATPEHSRWSTVYLVPDTHEVTKDRVGVEDDRIRALLQTAQFARQDPFSFEGHRDPDGPVTVWFNPPDDFRSYQTTGGLPAGLLPWVVRMPDGTLLPPLN